MASSEAAALTALAETFADAASTDIARVRNAEAQLKRLEGAAGVYAATVVRDLSAVEVSKARGVQGTRANNESGLAPAHLPPPRSPPPTPLTSHPAQLTPPRSPPAPPRSTPAPPHTRPARPCPSPPPPPYKRRLCARTVSCPRSCGARPPSFSRTPSNARGDPRATRTTTNSPRPPPPTPTPSLRYRPFSSRHILIRAGR